MTSLSRIFGTIWFWVVVSLRDHSAHPEPVEGSGRRPARRTSSLAGEAIREGRDVPLPRLPPRGVYT